MVQGKYQALFASVIIHVLLAIILMYTFSKTAFKHPLKKTSPIKSYLYQPVVQAKIADREIAKGVTNNITKNNKTIKKPVVAKKLNTILDKPLNNTVKAIQPQSSKPKIIAQQKVITSENSTKSVGIKAQALKQLYNLNNQITQQTINNELSDYFQHKSPSIMHAKPSAVPKSVVPLSKEQKRNRNTQRLDDSLAIIKGNNGLCTIEEDLSKVGIEGVKAYSSFNCGESTFDKSFREHMKKVRKKLGGRK